MKDCFFFIDELDRCKPSFSIAVIEIIKHFFDIENVCFVIISNTDALFKSFKKNYGNDFESDKYFERFIDRHINLPKLSINDFIGRKITELPNLKKCKEDEFLNMIINYNCALFNNNKRIIEKYLNEIEDFAVINNNQIPIFFLPGVFFLIAKKMENPEFYNNIIEKKDFNATIKVENLKPRELLTLESILSFLLNSDNKDILCEKITEIERKISNFNKIARNGLNPDQSEDSKCLKNIFDEINKIFNFNKDYNTCKYKISSYNNYISIFEQKLNFLEIITENVNLHTSSELSTT